MRNIFDVANVRKLQALIVLICSEVPFELNANKIAAALEIGRDTVVEYLKYLGDAGLKDSYVFADDWDMPDGAKLPLKRRLHDKYLNK